MRARALLSCCLLAACARRPVRIAAAVSLEPWLAPELASFSAGHRGTEVEASYGGSGALERQVEAGAPIDVFLSADPEWVDRLGAHVRLAARAPLAGNRLVLALSREAAARVRRPEDLAAAGLHRVALGRPASVPAGRYAEKTLRAMGLWDPLLPALVYADHVAEVRAWLLRGDVEAGFVYANEAAGFAVLPLPRAPPVVLIAALVSDTPRSREVFQYLTSRERASSLAAAGFLPPE